MQPTTAQPHPSAQPSTGAAYVPAPYWRRLIARLLDLAVCLPLAFAAVVVVLPLTAILIPFLSDDAWAGLAAFCCYFLAYVLVEYFLLRRRSGQTLGKGLLGLRVVPDGEPGDARSTLGISARSALLRMLVFIGPLMVSFALYYATYDSVSDEPNTASDAFLWVWMAVLVGSTISAVTDRRAHRGLHDMAAGTRVVRATRRGINMREDLKMLVPGKVSLEKETPSVTLTKTLDGAAPEQVSMRKRV